MNVSNTKSKNLVLASPLKQNLNKNRNWLRAPELLMAPLTRGGVEDMHKALGQEHEKNPSPRPSTVLPRTDPLEAKDRNARCQGQVPRTHRESDLQKKVFVPKSKNSALLEPRTGHFRGLADFEAKDFQLHPQGLHLFP